MAAVSEWSSTEYPPVIDKIHLSLLRIKVKARKPNFSGFLGFILGFSALGLRFGFLRLAVRFARCAYSGILFFFGANFIRYGFFGIA